MTVVSFTVSEEPTIGQPLSRSLVDAHAPTQCPQTMSFMSLPCSPVKYNPMVPIATFHNPMVHTFLNNFVKVNLSIKDIVVTRGSIIQRIHCIIIIIMNA